MTYVERILLNYLRGSKIKMEITGFDMREFEKALRQEAKCRLDMVADIVYEEEELMSDADKVAALRGLLDQDYFDKD